MKHPTAIPKQEAQPEQTSVEVEEPKPKTSVKAKAGKTKAETAEEDWVEDADGNFVKKEVMARQLKHIKAEDITPIKNRVIVSDMEFPVNKKLGGIIIRSDDGTTRGISSRWGKVYAKGPTNKDDEQGDWVLVEHGRWTRGVKINGNEELRVKNGRSRKHSAVSDEKPSI